MLSPKSILTQLAEGQILCALCHEPVQIKGSKTDENGRAVHEECYVRLLCVTQDGNPLNP
jgi:hypothetical protein